MADYVELRLLQEGILPILWDYALSLVDAFLVDYVIDLVLEADRLAANLPSLNCYHAGQARSLAPASDSLGGGMRRDEYEREVRARAEAALEIPFTEVSWAGWEPNVAESHDNVDYWVRHKC